MAWDLNIAVGQKRSVSPILATEAAECGLACVVMLARYHGHDVDLNGMRQRFSISLSGASLQSIMGLADQLGFSCRALRAEVEALKNVKLPAILHWNLDHFVVLAAIDSRFAVIHDPARGKRRVSLEELSNHFTGVVLEASPAASFTKVKAEMPIKIWSLWSHIEGFWSGAAQLLLLSIALQAASLATPFQMQLVVDEALERGDVDLLAIVALGFAALVIVQGLLEAIRGWTLQIVGFLMSYQMTGNLTRHLMRLSATFFERRHLGDILSRMSSSSAIQTFFTQGVISALIDGAMALVTVSVLFLYSPLLASIVLASVFLMLVVALAYYPAMRARLEEKLVASAKEQSFLMESVRAAVTIKVMGREAERESMWRNLFGNVINVTLASGQLGVTAGFLQSVIGGVQSVLVVYLGARMVVAADGLSVGMLIAFLSYRQTFTSRIGSLINQFVQFRLLRLHLERLSDIVTSTPDPISDSAPSEPANGAISMRNVFFRYGMSDPHVLENVSLDIGQGEFVAITGPSGSGKTTLLKLLLGLEQPTEGELLLDGTPAAPERWRGWRSNVGFVAQDDRLLSGTIADNICFFDPDMSMDQVKEAAKAARIHDEIVAKPMQYRSLIGDMGSTLSAGQRQRILLARALYRNPSILILDEGTANLDERTEDALADLIQQLPITRIVVAHRPSLVRRAHRVWILDQRRLRVQTGNGVLISGSI